MGYGRMIRALSFDAKRRTLRGKFIPSTAAEKAFFKQLKKVAQASGHLVERHARGSQLVGASEMQRELERYAQKLEPWAQRQARDLVEQVSRSNKRAYNHKSKMMGRALELGFAEQEVGYITEALIYEQVELIKSIPLEAGLRAQRIAYESALKGERAAPSVEVFELQFERRRREVELRGLEEEMARSTEVAVNRAMLIARTETARSNAAINETRARAAGSDQYRWHNSGDGAVRESHKIYQGRPLQGRIFSWNDPPTLSDGMTGHPGTFPNCRCFAEPVFLDE